MSSQNWRGENISHLIPWSQFYSDINQRHYKKNEIYRSVSLMNINAKFIDKVITNQIQPFIRTSHNYGNIFANYISDEGFVFRLYKNIFQNSIRITQ